MRRARKQSLANASAIAVGRAGIGVRKVAAISDWRTKVGLGKKSGQVKLKDRDLVFILRNLSTLTQSGVSLPKALATLAEEKALGRHRDMLHTIRRHLESGETFSSALARYGTAFDPVMINQIKVGEHSGTLGDTLATIARHCEDAHRLQSEIIKKLAYPIMLVVMGAAVITFLLTYVIPVFKKTYDDAHVTLPFITKVLIQ